MPTSEAREIAKNIVGDVFAHLKRQGKITVEDGEEYISVEDFLTYFCCKKSGGLNA